ncbi:MULTISPECIES: DUF4153 domain-containing protein [Peptoniphilus]|uniref:DUF4153 domain-containing protein n=2 Tax=Peptoniphilaceae TaxID=1570339 RepID=UPI0008D8EDD4|nr:MULTISPECIES: DUF4153 domain-containing protein [Peptoniphilus]MBS6610628.1 DUF4153 domain-containing protein [Peptoniphilus harei]MDU1044021.1 DUF4153 domain-containing protein [Peptoniphilus rhinitidis]MDU5377814.1 DUF4153 domain-containing protein [Peptoniphilus lacydonensis]MDU7302765.1 DUF4153 domain-containing protein [Peptoniphilus lacydonensis]
MRIFNYSLINFNSIKNTFKRFPLTIISAILATFFLIFWTFEKAEATNIKMLSYGIVFAFGIFLFSFISLFNEGLNNYYDLKNLKSNNLIKVLSYIITLPILYGIYEVVYEKTGALKFYDDKFIFFTLLAFLVVGSSFIGKFNYHKDYVVYVAKIFRAFIISIIYSFIVFVGLSGIIFALSSLFKIDFGSSIYIRIAIFSFVLFNVVTFFSDFPKARDSFIDYKYPKAFKILLVYIITPIVIIYTAILLAYFIKILVLWQIPNNLIVNLVLWFSIFSVLYLFFLSRIDSIEFINKFKRIFPITLFPLLGMMFFAIFLRIKEYGLTENRFLVMAAGVWVIISLIYFIFYRNNSNISVPIFLSIIILLSGVGPAPATKLSIKSQSSRFEKLLNKNNMIVGEEIKPNLNIKVDDKNQIIDIVNYMVKKDRVDKLSYVPKDFKLNEDSFTKLFGFSNRIDDNTYIGYSYSDSISNGNDLNFDVNISGYSNLIYVYSLDDIVTSGNYKFEKTKNKIKIYKKEDEEYNLELSINLSELKEKVKTLRKTKESISPEDLSIVEDSYKIIFTNIYFADEENLENSYIDFYFLTK